MLTVMETCSSKHGAVGGGGERRKEGRGGRRGEEEGGERRKEGRGGRRGEEAKLQRPTADAIGMLRHVQHG